MVGRNRKTDVKSRLGKRNFNSSKPKAGGIRDARDVLKKKGSAKVEVNVNIHCYALINIQAICRFIIRCILVERITKCFVVSCSRLLCSVIHRDVIII